MAMMVTVKTAILIKKPIFVFIMGRLSARVTCLPVVVRNVILMLLIMVSLTVVTVVAAKLVELSWLSMEIIMVVMVTFVVKICGFAIGC